MKRDTYIDKKEFKKDINIDIKTKISIIDFNKPKKFNKHIGDNKDNISNVEPLNDNNLPKEKINIQNENILIIIIR